MKATHNPESNRFEIRQDGRTAWTEYEIYDGKLDILHTIVPPQLEGQGVGSALVKATYDWGREQGLAPRASCRFAEAWLTRHPDAR